MALVNCPECGKQISNKATACPNCGYPVENSMQQQQESKGKSEAIIIEDVNEEKQRRLKLLACVLVAIFILGIIVTVVRNMTTPKTNKRYITDGIYFGMSYEELRKTTNKYGLSLGKAPMPNNEEVYEVFNDNSNAREYFIKYGGNTVLDYVQYYFEGGQLVSVRFYIGAFQAIRHSGAVDSFEQIQQIFGLNDIEMEYVSLGDQRGGEKRDNNYVTEIGYLPERKAGWVIYYDSNLTKSGTPYYAQKHGDD